MHAHTLFACANPSTRTNMAFLRARLQRMRETSGGIMSLQAGGVGKEDGGGGV